MPQICLYLQLHQPYRLGEYSLFDLGANQDYFGQVGGDLNKEVFVKVASKSYRPMLVVLARLLESQPEFRFALSCSGVFLEQLQAYQPDLLELLQRIVATGRVELLAETYYHSLASLYSKREFAKQVAAHQKVLKSLFGVTPVIFRNTELVYSNDIAKQVNHLGFKGLLTEAVDRYLHGRPRTVPYVDVQQHLPLLLKHADLSDDIAFRFSDKNWSGFPVTAEKYLQWVEVYDEQQIINLFMDFETFGEHQWESTGIFAFFEQFVALFVSKPWNRFVTPSQVLLPWQEKLAQLPVYDVPVPISWADVDRDLTAWTENAFQQDCLRIVYELEPVLLRQRSPALLELWRRLQTSDHFYYMCTKWAADGDVHAYFSPYESPYEAYRRYSVVLADMLAQVSLPQPSKKVSRITNR